MNPWLALTIALALLLISPAVRLAVHLLARWRDRRQLEEEWRRCFARGLTSKRLDEYIADRGKPWAIRPQDAAAGFRSMREAIPVDDRELSRARRIRRAGLPCDHAPLPRSQRVDATLPPREEIHPHDYPGGMGSPFPLPPPRRDLEQKGGAAT